MAELEVDVLVVIGIPHPWSVAVREVEGHRLFQLANAAVDPAGDGLLRPFKKRKGAAKRVSHVAKDITDRHVPKPTPLGNPIAQS